LFTIGTTTPCIPASSALPMIQAWFTGTRVNGTAVRRPSMARSISTISP